MSTSNRDNDVRFAALTAVAADAVVTIDEHSTILSWNRGAEVIFGRTEESMVGTSLLQIIPARHHAGHIAGLARIGKTNGVPFSGRTRELNALRADGSEFPIELTVSTWLGEQGRLFIGIIRDITDRRQIEDSLRRAKLEAEQAARAKSEFLAMMSHEIRTPLNGIIGTLQLLRGSRLDMSQSDWVETIHYSSQALLTILNDALDFSKLDAGRLQLEQIDFDLWRLGSSITDLMASRAAEKGISLSASAEEVVPRYLRGDPTRLRQILLNLVSNAVKFTDSGSVTMDVSLVESRADGALLRFSVTDTGVGIGRDAQARLFTPFIQADASVSRRFGGTGLGLAICKKIVDAMDGEIGVESRPGAGSSFWFEAHFALAAERREAFGEEPRALAPDGNPPSRILLADDSTIHQKIAKALLRDAGIAVDVVDDGQMAVTWALGGGASYDAVLMDVLMPVMDGLAATRKIRSHLGADRLPIIGMSAHSAEDEVKSCIDAGMNDTIAKPIDAARFYETLGRWVALPASRATPRRSADTATAAAQDGDLPASLPPFDIDLALKRVNGNRKLLRELIADFRQQNADAALRIRALITSGSRFDAYRTVHTLRGAAATLENVQLSGAAQRLETALRDDRAELEDEIRGLEAALQDTLAGAAELGPRTSAKLSLDTLSHRRALDTPSTIRRSKDSLILVIDDDPINIRLLDEILRGEHDIASTTDSARGLELARELAPDLVLLDVMMPGMNGFEVCSHLKADSATSHIPLIFITGLGDIDTEIRGLEVGAADYVTKPISPPAVRMRVRNQIALKQARDWLTVLAENDSLTGLANRGHFYEALEANLRRLRRSAGTLSLILADVDHFKAFNDTYGHVAGDDCLKQVGSSIRRVCTRSSDLAARYGGEEFGVALPDTDHTGAVALAERIRSEVAALAIPHRSSDAAPNVTVSLGVLTVTCRPHDAPKELIAAVDALLYQAKYQGRNRVVAKRRDDQLP